MDGEWTEIKAKKKQAPKPQMNAPQGSRYGGKTAKGTLVAGPVNQAPSRYGGGDAWGAPAQQKEVINHASAVADYDFGVDDDRHEELKFEMVSHVCAAAVAKARMDAGLTQGQLATRVNERTANIVELENGTARYNADLINRIESSLKVQIPRGRTNKKKTNNKKRY